MRMTKQKQREINGGKIEEQANRHDNEGEKEERKERSEMKQEIMTRTKMLRYPHSVHPSYTKYEEGPTQQEIMIVAIFNGIHSFSTFLFFDTK